MRLAQRLIATFVAITVILVLPAIYGLSSLNALKDAAELLRSRDAVSLLALGRLQIAYSELDNAEKIYLALGPDPDGRSAAAEDVRRAQSEIEAELETLSGSGYEEVTRDAQAAWDILQQAIAEEQSLVRSGNYTAAEAHRAAVVDPALEALNATLIPIGAAITAAGEEEVLKAQLIAATALTTTLLALAIALVSAVLIGLWTGRNLLRPVGELRRGMAKVAEADFEPNLHHSIERKDEIGDLARSFSHMAQELAALDRMKAEFVSVASHELKTPLSVIRGYTSLLRDEVYGQVSAEQKKILTSVGDQTDRLGRLIQQLLDVSRFEAGVGRLEIRRFSLRAFLDELAVSFEALAIQNQIQFKVEVDSELPEEIEGDADRLNEVVGNLLSNAFKFTERGGTIRLMAEVARENGDGVTIEVIDTGIGIPPDQLPRIFDKFYQVENEAQPKSVGTGLGLAISKEITEAHGGTISADSRLGKGTTFRVFLPSTGPKGHLG